MKKRYFGFLFLLSIFSYATQQTTEVDKAFGVVVNKNGEALADVAVQVKGTDIGVATDREGKFSINVSIGNILVFQSLGYEYKELKIENLNIPLKVVLLQEAKDLKEVVVTALGIKKEKKSLGYSVTELSSKDIVQNRDLNIANVLAGMVSGVDVSSTSTGLGGSTRVVIRGNSSITGNNNPLYVIDGVPIDNTQENSVGLWGGNDGGDGLSSFNQDDIESVSVLKGASASALYGSRASNGVILITTKKGGSFEENRWGVEINSTTLLEKIYNLNNWQKVYGLGKNNVKPTSVTTVLDAGLNSWGGKIDNSPTVDLDGKKVQYRLYNNAFDFYKIGLSLSNSIALNKRFNKGSIRFSASDSRNQATIPNSGLNRNTFSLNGEYNLHKITFSSNWQYSIQTTKNRPNVSDAPGNANFSIYSTPSTMDISWMKGLPNKLGANNQSTEKQFTSNIYNTNPYWAAYQFFNEDTKNRIVGNAKINIDISSWLYVSSTIGLDSYSVKVTNLTPKGTAFDKNGSISEAIKLSNLINTDALIGLKDINLTEDLKLNSFVGVGIVYNQWGKIKNKGINFLLPLQKLFATQKKEVEQIYENSQVNSVYGSLELNYMSNIYLTTTLRNDWFSTLNKTNNSILYPSISLSYIFLDNFDENPFGLSYGKLRLSWSEVGGTTNPYQLNMYYDSEGNQGSGILMKITGSAMANYNLKPSIVRETEAGLNIAFFENQINIDVSVYEKNTLNDIVPVSISPTTGYASTIINVGKMNNQGLECLVQFKVVESDIFSWNTTFNYSYNKNTLKFLAKGLYFLEGSEVRTQTARIRHEVNKPFSGIYGTTHKKIKGQLVYDSLGMPIKENNYSRLGNGVSENIFSVTNYFYYQGFNFSFLLDSKWGGYIYSGTNSIAYNRGLHTNTLKGRETGLTLKGVDEKGIPTTFKIKPEKITNYYKEMAGIAEYFIYDASFIKLRTVSLGYTFDRDWLEDINIYDLKLSVIARNLWLIYSKVPNIDPESNYNASNDQGLEYFGMPQTRSLGISISLSI